MTLGKRIKEQRKSCGLSQEKVADLLGISRQSVTKWENGQSVPSTKNLFKLAEILGTTVDMLIFSKESSENAKQPLSEQVYNLYKLEETKKRAEHLKAIKILIIIFGIMSLVLLISAGIVFAIAQKKAILAVKIQAIISISLFITSASLFLGYCIEKKHQQSNLLEQELVMP